MNLPGFSYCFNCWFSPGSIDLQGCNVFLLPDGPCMIIRVLGQLTCQSHLCFFVWDGTTGHADRLWEKRTGTFSRAASGTIDVLSGTQGGEKTLCHCHAQANEEIEKAKAFAVGQVCWFVRSRNLSYNGTSCGVFISYSCRHVLHLAVKMCARPVCAVFSWLFCVCMQETTT